ncbi:MAG TPA: hypothetical protein VNY05_23850 [Candidatus Acidoferrales bacterium]|jgi:hypothetical protein|nr:hypothetical protein [Candidatus Acidoferrales bacterium]
MDVTTGADKMLAPIDLPASANGIAELQSASRWLTLPHVHREVAHDISTLESRDQPRQKTRPERLLRR